MPSPMRMETRTGNQPCGEVGLDTNIATKSLQPHLDRRLSINLIHNLILGSSRNGCVCVSNVKRRKPVVVTKSRSGSETVGW